MKPVQLLVTIALVGAGILLYDTLRSGEMSLDPAPYRDVVRPAAVPDERPDRPALRGTLLDTLPEWKAEIEARVADLEVALQGAPRGTKDGTGGGGGAIPARPPDAWRPEDVREGEEPRFDPQDLAWFRALDEELLRIRREESEVRSITAQLQRIRSDLPDGMRDDIVAATRTFRAEKRDILTRSRRESMSLERRQAAFDEARQRYDSAIQRVAPVEAEEIIQRFGSYPGRRLGKPFGRNR